MSSSHNESEALWYQKLEEEKANNPTYYIDRFHELCMNEILEDGVLMCVKWMGNDAVKAMMKANDIEDLETWYENR